MSGTIIAAISATKQTDTVPEHVEQDVLKTARIISRAMGRAGTARGFPSDTPENSRFVSL